MKPRPELLRMPTEFPRTPRRGSCLLALVAGGLLSAPSVNQAATIMDWLTYQPHLERSEFSLLNDAMETEASGSVTLNAGTFAPSTPAPGVLQSSFWVLPPSFQDSLTGDATVATTKLQVAPQAGQADYALSILGLDLNGMVFAVGQLFNSPLGGTAGIGITARTAGGTLVPLDFLGTNGWDDGLRLFTSPLDWDAAQESLTPGSMESSQSAFAFFRVPIGASIVTNLEFQIPNGFASGSGDTLEFAFGFPIPEPGTSALLLLGLLGSALRRRRRRE